MSINLKVGTTRKVLRDFAQWLGRKAEIIHPDFPQGKFCDDEDMQRFADEYWELLKEANGILCSRKGRS
jgi:hypothetical protein